MDTPHAASEAAQPLARQLRSLVAFCGVSLLALTVAVGLAARALIASFDTIERDETARKAEQVYRAFEADLRQLAISDRDYAEWDEAADFIGTRAPDFLPANFQADQLIGMHVDVVWIVDADGRDLYSALADRAAKTSASPA